MARESQAAIRLTGVDKFRLELRALGPKWTKELSKLNKEVGEEAAKWARGGASQQGGVVAKAAYSIVGAGTATGARVRWGGSGYEFADGAFYGAKKYPQFSEWIGTGWKVAQPGGGPYGINPALAARKDDIGEMFLDKLTELAATVDAFYERSGADALANVGVTAPTSSRSFSIT